MPFAAMWMDLEFVIVSELNQRQISYALSYMWTLKNGTNEPIYTTEIRVTDVENKLEFAKGERVGERDKLGDWGRRMYITIYKVNSD